jgi:hypothetical protein
MTMISCSRRRDVAAMLHKGYWPDACEEGLRAHIDGCSRCREQVLIAQIFQQARMEAVGEARLGSAQALWWKAQLCQREAALRQVSRPVTLAQGFALMIGLIATCGFLIWGWSRGLGWLALRDLQELLAGVRVDLQPFFATFGPENSLVVLMVGLMAIALLGGVVYLASDRQ